MLRSRDHVGQLEYRFFLLSHRFLSPFNLSLLTPFLSFHSALITLCRLCEGCLQFFYCILYHSHMIFVRHTRQFMYPSFRVLLIYRASFPDYLNTPHMPACWQSSNFELFRKTQRWRLERVGVFKLRKAGSFDCSPAGRPYCKLRFVPGTGIPFYRLSRITHTTKP